MGSVDDRVVAMKFDNQTFENRVAQTINTMGRLKSSLDFEKQAAGLQNLSNAGSHFSLDSMAHAIEGIGSKFSAMGVVGFTVIQKLTNAALDFGKKTASALVDPLIAGGKARAENIEQAKFQFEGLGIDVDKAMASALAAVKGTAFGLGDAAKAAAQLGASGIEAGDQMTTILRSVAGTAAMTGKSFSEISDIFISSAAIGKVTNQDLQQFATRGVNAAAVIAKQLGKTEAQIHEMATEGKLDFKTFSDAMDKAFGAHATEANKTYSGSIANMHAALSRLGASFFGPRMVQQRDLFNAMTPVIDKFTAAVKPLVDMMLTMTGLDTGALITFFNRVDFNFLSDAIPGFISGFSDIFKSIHQIISVIKQAWVEVFPPQAESVLVTASKIFAFLVHVMTPTPQILDEIQRIFRGVFSVLSIGIAIVKDIAVGFLLLFRSFKDAGGEGILAWFAGLGDKLYALKQQLVDGGGINDFIAKVAKAIQEFDIPGKIDKISDKFNLFKASINAFFEEYDIPGKIHKLSDDLNHLKDVVKKLFSKDSIPGIDEMTDGSWRLAERWGWLIEVGHKLLDFFGWIGEGIKDVAKSFGGFIGSIIDALKNGDYSGVHDALNVGLFATILGLIHQFLKNGIKFDFGEGLLANISKSFEAMTNTLSAMQAELKADALLKIAEAIGILAISALVLSTIDSALLTKALTALAVGFGELMGAFAVLNKVGGDDIRDGIKLDLMAAGIFILAGAILALSLSVKFLSTMNIDELAKGLGAIAILLLEVIGFTKLIDGEDVLKLDAIGPGLIAVGVGLIALSGAVLILGSMDLKQLAQGLLGMAGVLVVMFGLAKVMDAKDVVKLNLLGPALIELGLGLIAISAAVVILGNMDLNKMVQGLLGIAGVLAILAITMTFMPATLPLIGAGLMTVGLGLIVIATAVALFGAMDLGNMLKGLLGIALALGILAVAAIAMEGTLLGSAAILVAAGALIVLALAVKMFNDIGLGSVLTALLGIVIVIGVIAGGALLLDSIGAPLVIAALGLSLVVFGAGLILVGAGALLFAAALWLIVDAIKNLVDMGTDGIQKFIEILPDLGTGFAKMILSFLGSLLEGTPDLVEGFGKVVTAILDFIIKEAPKFGEAIGTVVNAIVKFLDEHQDQIIQAGWRLLLGILHGIDQHINEVSDTVASIVIKFLNKLTEHLPAIMDAGARTLTEFLRGISRNLPKVMDAAADVIIAYIQGITRNIGRVMDAGGDLIVAFIQGLQRNVIKVQNAAVDFIIAFIRGLQQNIQRMIQAGWDFIIDFINGLSDSIDRNAPRLREAGLKLATSIINGLTGGLGSLAGQAIQGMVNLATDMLNAAKGVFLSHSPSKATYNLAQDVVKGFVLGIGEDTSAVKTMSIFANDVMDEMTNTFSKIASITDQMAEFNPTIAPVLDLTDVERNASRIGSLLNIPQLAASVTFDQAASLAVASREHDAPTSATQEPTVQEVNFTQTNISSEPLTTGQIYRNTKSQLSLAKEGIRNERN